MYCEECGERIYQGDTYYDIDGKPVCIDCALEYLDENCKTETEDGEAYLVDDMVFELDEANLLLKTCEKTLEVDDVVLGDPRDEPEWDDGWKGYRNVNSR